MAMEDGSKVEAITNKVYLRVQHIKLSGKGVVPVANAPTPLVGL